MLRKQQIIVSALRLHYIFKLFVSSYPQDLTTSLKALDCGTYITLTVLPAKPFDNLKFTLR